MVNKSDCKKVLVISPRDIFYQGLVNILSSSKTKFCFEWAKDNIYLVNEINNDLAVDLFIVDCRFPSDDVFKILELIKSGANEPNVLCILKELNKDEEIEFLRMGVKGVLLETSDKELFRKSIECILKGQMWMRREILEHFVANVLSSDSSFNGFSENNLSKLSSREIEILTLVANNLTNKEIADKLYITEKTVKNYLTQVYKKLYIKKRSEVHTKVKPLIANSK